MHSRSVVNPSYVWVFLQNNPELKAIGTFCHFLNGLFRSQSSKHDAQYRHLFCGSGAKLMNTRLTTRSLLLCAALGLTAVVTLLPSPQSANAYIARQEIRVERLKNESYGAFLRRSELVLRAALQRGFDRDVVMSSMFIFIIGQHQGMEAPVMSVEVSRSQWQSRPDVRVWATYYRMSQMLLGFGDASTPDLLGGTSPIQPFSPSTPQPIKPLPLSPTNPSLRTRKMVTPTPSPVPTTVPVNPLPDPTPAAPPVP